MTTTLLVKIDLFIILVSLFGMLGLWLDTIFYRRSQMKFYGNLSHYSHYVSRKINLAMKDIVADSNIDESANYRTTKTQDMVDIRKLILQADTFLARGYLSEAEKKLVEARSFNPDNIDVNSKLAEVYIKGKDYKKAVILLSDLLNANIADEYSKKLKLLLVKAYREMNNIENALLILNSIHQQYENDIQVMTEMAYVLLEIGREKDALIIFTKLIDMTKCDISTLKIAHTLAVDMKEHNIETKIITKILAILPYSKSEKYRNRKSLLESY